MTVVQANTVAGFGLVMRMAMTVLMAWIVVSAYKPSSTYGKWVAAVLWVCGFNLLLVFLGYETEAGLLNYFIGIVSPFIQIWGARTVREPMPGRWIFTTGWLLYSSHHCFRVSLQFGRLKTGEINTTLRRPVVICDSTEFSLAALFFGW